MQEALGLDEIKSAIAEHLKPPELIQCIRVAKAWHASFLPHLWANLSLTPHTTTPPIDQVYRYGHHIRHLTLRETAPKDFIRVMCSGSSDGSSSDPLYSDSRRSGPITRSVSRGTGASIGHGSTTASPLPPPPRLLTLDLLGTYYEHEPVQNWVSVLELVQAHCSTLQSICYRSEEALPSGHSLWEAVALCARLETIEIHNVAIPQGKFLDLWRMFSKAKFLSLTDVAFNLSDSEYKTMMIMDANTVSTLQELSFSDSGPENAEGILRMMRQSPDLRLISADCNSLPLASGIFPIVEVCRSLKSEGFWKNLTQFKVLDPGLQDHHLATVLDSMATVTCFMVGKSGFGSKAFTALKRHFSTLIEWNTFNCKDVTSGMVRAVLENCPRLETMMAPEIEARDIVHGEPWQCAATLRNWDLYVAMTDFEADGNPLHVLYNHQENKAVMNRLSSLVNVRMIDAARRSMIIGSRSDNRLTLEFRLGRGLEALESCKLIEWLLLPDKDAMSASEYEWILRHWPRLNMLRAKVQLTVAERMDMSKRILGRAVLIY